MKKICLWIILLWLSFLFSACSLVPKTTKFSQNENIETNISEYTNKINRLNFTYPKNRNLEENKFGFSVIISTPNDNEINEKVWIKFKELPKFLSVQEYYEETIFELQNTLLNFKEIETKDIKKNELNGKSITYQHIWWNKWEIKIKSKETFLISPENIVYIINYIATKDTFNKHLKEVESLIESFTVLAYEI